MLFHTLLRFIVSMCQPIRAFISFWLIVCMLFSLMPLGCHSVNVRHAAGQPGQPHIPEYTAEQLKECGELLQEGIKPGQHPVDARVELDADGRVLDVTTTGEPNPDIGMCIRVALRDLTVSKEVIDEAALRRHSSSSANAGTISNREHIGQVETVVVVTVTIVFVDVIIEAAVVAVGISVTATITTEAVKGAQGNAGRGSVPRGTRKPHQPVARKWLDNGGSIDQKADGTTTYTRSDGVAVRYDKEGFPDLTPYRHPTVKDVQIEFTGSYEKDNKLADKAAGITEEKRQAEGYTWHHHQDGKTMQLIRRDVHKDFFHTGGMAGAR